MFVFNSLVKGTVESTPPVEIFPSPEIRVQSPFVVLLVWLGALINAVGSICKVGCHCPFECLCRGWWHLGGTV